VGKRSISKSIIIMGFKIKKPQFQIAALNNLGASTMSNFNTTMEDFWAKELARKKAVRGTDTYSKVTNAANSIMAPYAEEYGTDKKYPYLSSRHHTMNSIHNPMLTNPRRSKIEDSVEMDEGILTIAEERKRYQDRLLNEGGDLSAGTKGSTYFGSKFNKDAEKAAKIANERHEYLLNAANQGEEALNAALSQQDIYNKHGVAIGQEMPVISEFPISTQNTGSAKNLAGGYAANPSGQSLRNIHNFQDLRDRASSAQDYSDRFRNVGYDFEDMKRKTNNFEITIPEWESFSTELAEREKNSPGTIRFETLKSVANLGQ
tara:strand:- start:2878 stop:3831 length:954 start_codon:yes stop_codon:yes gene_type:complete